MAPMSYKLVHVRDSEVFLSTMNEEWRSHFAIVYSTLATGQIITEYWNPTGEFFDVPNCKAWWCNKEAFWLAAYKYLNDTEYETEVLANMLGSS